MGTYANNHYFKGAHMPEEKVPEFQNRLEQLFQAGGMMEMEHISMFGTNAVTLRKARMNERGMNFYYNYFEEDTWEDAGYDIESNRVGSGKIGWGKEFTITVVAAYVLENLYTDGPGMVNLNGSLADESIYTGWINYLFNENFHTKNKNPWKLFDMISTETNVAGWRNTNWARFVTNAEGEIGYSEIYAVQNGIDKMLAWVIDSYEQAGIPHDHDNSRFTFIDVLRLIINSIRSYREKNDLPEDEQLQMICNHLRKFYQNSDLNHSEFTEKYDMNDNEKHLFFGLSLLDLPAVAVKTLSEEYDKDFWELWGEIRDAVYGTQRTALMMPEESAEKPVSTMDFLGVCADDMIYFWREDGDIIFSDKLKNWFLTLKKRYDEIMNESFTVENPIKWMLELMHYAHENYYRIYTFAEFFEESVTHLSERSYIVLWKLYEEMLHAPENAEAVNVILVSDGPEHEDDTRVTLRRYMALVANAELRKKVFGF